MRKHHKHTWTIKVSIAQCWVEDGFDFDADRIAWLRENLLAYAHPSEVEVEVIHRPRSMK